MSVQNVSWLHAGIFKNDVAEQRLHSNSLCDVSSNHLSRIHSPTMKLIKPDFLWSRPVHKTPVAQILRTLKVSYDKRDRNFRWRDSLHRRRKVEHIVRRVPNSATRRA